MSKGPSMTHVACKSKLCSVVRSSLQPCPGNWMAIRRAVENYAPAAHTIKYRQCICDNLPTHSSFANTFMGWFEAKFVYTYELQPLMWVSFIDDIFLIWQHGHDSLKLFEDHLNNCLDSIKFETETSTEEVHFLDVIVRLSGNVISTVYTQNQQTLTTIWASFPVTLRN